MTPSFLLLPLSPPLPRVLSVWPVLLTCGGRRLQKGRSGGTAAAASVQCCQLLGWRPAGSDSSNQTNNTGQQHILPRDLSGNLHRDFLSQTAVREEVTMESKVQDHHSWSKYFTEMCRCMLAELLRLWYSRHGESDKDCTHIH